ncbi:MAG UNVERIFIED_CONTAM: hypothetical protein LVR29_17395 [Microcystis novacekii LVE1205-3]|jgi:hypothetical protein
MTFYFLAPENTYQGLTATNTGVDKVTMSGSPNTVDETAPVCTVEALLRSGYGVRKVIYFTTGTGASLRRSYARIIVVKDKASTSSLPQLLSEETVMLSV